jgi:hypothetical protein
MLYQKSIDCYLVTNFPILPCTTILYQKCFSSTFPLNLVPIKHFFNLSIHSTCNQVKYHINFEANFTIHSIQSLQQFRLVHAEVNLCDLFVSR